MTAASLALGLLIYLGIAAVWDLLDENAVTIKYGNPFRLTAAVLGQVALFWLCLVAVGASATASVAIVSGYVILALFTALVREV